METKELIQALRLDAEWAHANEWETPITLGDHLDAAADALSALLSVTAERDALKDDFADFACSGFTNAAPYCANKSPECTDAHEWCINEKCKGFYPNACGVGKEQNDAPIST